MRIRQFSFGVALTSGASLALSLLITRIFSVTMYYHFAFLLVSLALLGVAVSGVAIYLLPRIFTEERLHWLAGLFAVSIAPLTWIALHVAVRNPMSIDLRPDNVQRLLKLYAATALPFLASGFAISLAIAGAKERIGRIYAFDLIGAALGCVVIIPVISQVGGPGAVLMAGAVAAVGGILLARSGADSGAAKAVSWAGAFCAVALVAVAIGPASRGSAFKIAQGSKFLNESAVEFERWNAFSRVTVSRGEADHKWIHIDADAATRMYSGDIARQGYEPPRRFSESRVASLVYALRREGPALIIGPGGGPDVVGALRAGVPRVVGVEVNPLIAETVMKEHFASYNGDLYRQPSVSVFVDDGRSFVRRAPEAFSSIQATLVDTWAASAAGAFTLTENNLYTVEAFEDYLAHLQPHGVLSMTRWYGRPPVEFVRLLALGREALRRLAIPDLEHRGHFFVASDGRMATMLLKKAPFASAETSVLIAEAQGAGLRVLHTPEGNAPTRDPFLERFFLHAPETFFAALPFDVSPTTDDRPFFFYTVRPAEFTKLLANVGQLERNNLGLVILQILLLVSVALTVLLVVAPLFLFRSDVLRENRAGKLRTLGYFLCLGLGFILVELGLMHRFILFLGHPIYALAVVLATLLAASGIGSALSPRVEARFGNAGAVRRIIAALAALLVLYVAALPMLFGVTLGVPLPVRITIAVALVAALGILMGMLLPLGVRRADSYGPDLVKWGWGLNGAASVVGSVLSTVLSMHFGFSTTLAVGLAAYVIGAAVLGRGSTQRAGESATRGEEIAARAAV